MKKLKTNNYGSIDIRRRIPKGTSHIRKMDYKPIQINKVCEKLGVDYAPAFLGFEYRGFGNWKALHDGVIILSRDYIPVIATAQERRERLRKRKKLQAQRNYRFAENYASKDEALSDAALAMRDLARYSKNDRCRDNDKVVISDVKKRFTEFLYERNYCTDVSVQPVEQTKDECWRCYGFGCTHCAADHYYVFHFKVEEVEFDMHLPAEAVDYHVDITLSGPNISASSTKPMQLDGERFQKVKKIALIEWVMDGQGKRYERMIVRNKSSDTDYLNVNGKSAMTKMEEVK